jgi:hypothetical protein
MSDAESGGARHVPRCNYAGMEPRSSESGLRVYRFFAGGSFRATAAFTSALSAPASTVSPSRMSIARRQLYFDLALALCPRGVRQLQERIAEEGSA